MAEAHRGATYDQQLAMARAAERLGFGGFFRTEHFLATEGDGKPGPTDSWVTLGAIARETSVIRLGTIMTCTTFRYPALLAVQVAQVDQMSGGRVDLGLGCGWFEAEHAAMGIPFP
jgi:alkanesulfonate monooxygenase SsuD/methylene tetrahydromethanopterin reductase-like flavin-dependent oxidoreductase (luciferase family)